MNKNRYKALLRHLLDELPKARQKALDERLATDRQLQQKLAEWKLVLAALADFQPDFSAGFEHRVLYRLSIQNHLMLEERKAWSTMLRFSFTVAAAVIILMVWIYLQEQSFSVEHLLGLAGLRTDDFANLLANY